MDFLQPSTLPPIATYRVLNSDGDLVDDNRNPPAVLDEQVLLWYRNMVMGTYSILSKGEQGNQTDHTALLEMDS